MPAKPVGSQLDFQKIPHKNFVPESSATAPTAPVDGQQWTDSSIGRAKVFENGSWVLVSQTGSELLANKGAANGYASLDAGTKVPIAQVPTGTSGTTVAFGNHTHNLDALTDVTVTSPITGNVIRWSGTEWVNATLAIADVSGLQAALDAKAASVHTHAAADVTSGTFDIARLPVAPSGTSNTTQVVRADDSRLSNSRTPTGTAGGDLTGTYPNPTIAVGAVSDVEVAAANKDGVAGTPSLRTLGTGAQQALAGNTRLDQLALPTAPVALNGQRLTGVGTPTTGTDAVTKDYADGLRAGLRIKDAVRAATTANITLSGTQTIDTIAVVAGDRVLVKNQTTTSANGIYVVAAGAWTRATDADTAAELTDGATTFVQQGGQADTTWAQVNAITNLGTDAQSWVQQGAAASYTAGAGLTQTGNTFDVVGTANRITVNADSVDIAATYAGQTSITTLGTIATGTWEGTTVALAKGGTGATTAAAARTNLGAVGKYAQDLGALTAGTELVITHGLGSSDVQATFREVASGYDVLLNWRVISATQIGVTADVAYAASALRAVVVG